MIHRAKMHDFGRKYKFEPLKFGRNGSKISTVYDIIYVLGRIMITPIPIKDEVLPHYFAQWQINVQKVAKTQDGGRARIY